MTCAQYVCAGGGSTLLRLFAPSVAEKNVNVGADLTCDGCSYHGDYTIELQEINAYRPSNARSLRGSNSTCQVPERSYMITVSGDRQS
jgi:hypothetical protein